MIFVFIFKLDVDRLDFISWTKPLMCNKKNCVPRVRFLLKKCVCLLHIDVTMTDLWRPLADIFREAIDSIRPVKRFTKCLKELTMNMESLSFHLHV